jgi:heptosyltransferase-2
LSDLPRRLLVVMPSWLGDVVMATPALRALRTALRGSFIGALIRPGMDQLLAGSDLVDELHVERSSGVFGPKFIAAKLRPRRYDAALLLTNSFSTALITRIAGIPRRIGYDRDARGLLLSERLRAPVRADGSFAAIPAVRYYLDAARAVVGASMPEGSGLMELATTPEEEASADRILAAAGVRQGERYVVLNPGGNNVAKRWPAERFGALADHLAATHGVRVVVNGSPAEGEVLAAVAAAAKVPIADVSTHGITIGALKAIVRRAALMVTNDTGPRHIAAAFGVPLVSMFGPTDHRWTTIATRAGAPEFILLADPELPEDMLANDAPERCRIERIELAAVVRAADSALSHARSGGWASAGGGIAG